MHNSFFRDLENLPNNSSVNLEQVMDNLVFNADGLVPVITQDAITGVVLMFAWMNAESLKITLETNRMTYWSRSRGQLWKKGESSGNTQELKELFFDCDGDCLLCRIIQHGPACHTGRPNCFY